MLRELDDRELYEKSLLVKSIVEGIIEGMENKDSEKYERKTIADKIIGYMQENPGRPSCETRIAANRVNKRYDIGGGIEEESKKDMQITISEGGEDKKSMVEAKQDKGLMQSKTELDLDSKRGYDEATEDTKENTRVEDSQFKGIEYEDYRVSDVFEEGKDKRIARVECVKEKGFHINPFRKSRKDEGRIITKETVKREIPRSGDIIVKNSITDVSCNYFVTSKLNKMCDYIAQNTDCSIF